MRICSLIALIFLVGCATARPWTTEEKWLLAASCTATVADMTTTLSFLDDGDWEINPIMGKHPTDTEVVATMVTSQILTIVVAHFWDDFRKWILGVKTGINAGFAYHNIRTH